MKVTSSSPVARAIGTAALWLTLALSPAAIGAQESESDERNESGGLPLSADRSIPIDMSEGSWISLDVSPDGETIVFDYLGNLFTIPIGGGKATQLTSGLAFDAQPRFSPDGALSANVRETRSTQRIRVGRRQRKRTCWDCEREWKRMVVPLEPGRPSEARQLLRTQR